MNTAGSIPFAGESAAVKSAAEWRVRHEAGLSPSEQAEFDAWLAASPRHAGAWREVNATLSAFERLRATGLTNDFVRELSTRRRQHRWRLLARSTLGLAAAAVLLLIVRPALSPHVAAESAGPVIVRTVRHLLADGSRVELDTGAKIAVNYSTARREVRLLQGKALFLVEPNSARPFVVMSGPVEVRAVGTAFVVQMDARAVDVLVTEGRVTVVHREQTPDPGEATVETATPVLVDAGSQLALLSASEWSDSVQPRQVPAAEINQRLAWRHPRMQLAGTSLADAVTVLNRENLMQVVIADPELAKLRLTGVFRLDDARGFVEVLATHYGVRVDQRRDGTTVLRGG